MECNAWTWSRGPLAHGGRKKLASVAGGEASSEYKFLLQAISPPEDPMLTDMPSGSSGKDGRGHSFRSWRRAPEAASPPALSPPGVEIVEVPTSAGARSHDSMLAQSSRKAWSASGAA